MKFSKYVHCINYSGYYILYNAATTKMVLITKKQYMGLNDELDLNEIFDDEQLLFLSRIGYFSNEMEFDLNQCIIDNNHDKVNIFSVYMILTEQCNMNCKYCSQSAYRTRTRMSNMTPNTVESVLKKFYQTITNRKRTIVLYGGEPTLNRPGIETTINYIRRIQCDHETEIVMFTNGILLDNSFIKLLHDGQVKIIISIDGPKGVNDEYRMIGENGSYNQIIEAIDRLKEHAIPFGTSSTIAAHNVKHLREIVSFLYEKFNPISIGLNPFHYAPESRNQMAVEESKMATKMLEAYEVARHYGIYIEQIMRRIRPFVLSTPRFKDCPSCGGMVRVLPDGSFGPCGHFMEEKKEREKSNYTFEDSHVMKKWNARINAGVIDKCKTCISMALCGGGCPFNSLKNGGDIFSANDDRSCVQSRIFLDWLIREAVCNLPTDTFYNVTVEDKKKILGNINLNRYVPMSSYSKYGEFSLNERYL